MAAHSILRGVGKVRHGLWLMADGFRSILAGRRRGHRPHAIGREASAMFAVALVIAGARAALMAHDIPADVTVQAFAKPDGNRLRLIVRVPLAAMRDMDYPKPRGTTRGDLMDLGRAESTLRDASTLWISDFIDLYENGVQLPKPQVVAVRASLQSDRSFTSYDGALAHV